MQKTAVLINSIHRVSSAFAFTNSANDFPNMHISRCKNCLKYFASAYSGADYCDRVNPEGKTCKWTGSKKTYASNIKADENLVLYEKIYQSLQYKRRRTTDDEMLEKLNFNIILLTKCRAKYKSGEHSADKFLEK